MDQIVSINWVNKILLIASVSCIIFCLVLEQWLNMTNLPIYIPIIWSLIVITVSTWFSCLILKYTLKATTPLNIEPLTLWFRERLKNSSKHTPKLINSEKIGKDRVKTEGDRKNRSMIEKLLLEIDEKFISSWYDGITEEKTFRQESKELLQEFFFKISTKLTKLNRLRMIHKLMDVFLLHLKEYRRSLKRIDKGSCKDEAYRCSHPGSRSSVALEHTLHRMVILIAREFLQWEHTSSLPCKLFLSVLAKRLLMTVQEVSEPRWLFNRILRILKTSEATECKNGIVSRALTGGLTSVTAPVIPRPLAEAPPTFEITEPDAEGEDSSQRSGETPALALDGLISHQKGLWADDGYDMEDDGISPVYEEPADFATTIARLRNLLQQKSTATTPFQMEEKSYVVCEGSQFSNLVIPWTEFHTAPDGSQQLLYCIQFDDVEQHGEDLFETTTATTRRQYSDFIHLHSDLEEMTEYAGVMAELKLPDGGRTEMETYLRTLCSKLPDSPPQLRHFLRPSGSGGQKADAVAPRFDRLLAKTVTGMFNTLRTVVPGFEMEEEEMLLPTLMPLADIPWRFVEDVKTKSLAQELQQLVTERIDYCTVDTAYEAIEGGGDSELLTHWWETANCAYDEELDEMDVRLPMTCSLLDILCEVLVGINSPSTVRQEAVIRWIKLFFGSCIEDLIQDFIADFSIFFLTGLNNDLDIKDSEDLEEKVVKGLVDKMCGDLKFIFSEDELKKMATYFVASFNSKRVNSDIVLQILDIAASELLAACREDYKKD